MDDLEIDDFIQELDLDRDELIADSALLDIEDFPYGEEGGAYTVRCKHGCGTFPLTDVLCGVINYESSSAKFRCPACNELQEGPVYVVD
jgi:hypothetical protein